jgi:hypothetical protein
MKNLDTFRFTARSDRAFSADGWFLPAGAAVDALSGNDVITGESGEVGISIAGTLDAGDGNDSILAIGYYDSLLNSGTIRTGAGNDRIEGSSTENGGIVNSGFIHTGSGADALYGMADDAGFGSLSNTGVIETGAGGDIVDANGISNSGLISTGPGGDLVIGQPFDGFYGIENSSRIIMDSGNDRIVASGIYKGIWNHGQALISTGDGNDTIQAALSEEFGADQYAIANEGLIRTGRGNDLIRTSLYGTRGGSPIDNSGSIVTGKGADVVDALWGGFFGDGLKNLGSGRDRLWGFGTGLFRGGTGIDTLVFTPGRYAIERLGGGEFLIGGLMRVSGFEAFGQGANDTSFATAASNGFVLFA